jgi:hypothetical protein
MPFKLKVKTASGNPAVGSLDTGELGYNTVRDVLFVGNASAAATEIVTLGATQTLTDKTITTPAQFTSTLANGTAPFVITSSTLVTNLNADLLDGQHGAHYLNYNNLTNRPTIPTGFTITANATDGLFDITGTNGTNAVTYAVGAYAAKQATLQHFYLGTTNPTVTTRLNLDAALYATQLYDNGTRVLTAHPTVSAASSSDNSGRTYIQDILLDSFGHVTGIATATETVTNTDTATAVDNILDGSNSGTAITYAPYATNLASTGNRLYTTTDVPTATTRLNLSSYLWATRLHSLGIYGGDTSGGNLTIGSTSNATKGTITIDSNTDIQNGPGTTFNITSTPTLSLGTSSGSSRGYVRLYGTTAGSYGVVQMTNSNLHIDSPSAGDLYINNYVNRPTYIGMGGTSGTLGIGTTTTPERLTVNGNIRLSAAGKLSTTTGALTLATEAGNSNIVLSPNGSGITTTANAVSITSSTASTNTTTGALIVTGGVGIGGAVNIGGGLTIGGDLTINGNTTTINATTITVDDKNIELGSVASPTNTTADGGGITLKGATDKTFNWVNSTGSWTSSENVEVAAGKAFRYASSARTEFNSTTNSIDFIFA